MQIIRYMARDSKGDRVTNDAAQILGEEFAKLSQIGRLTADVIVQAATPESSRLHPFFEWDDKKAAHEYRRVQAGHYVRSIEVVIDNGGKEVSTVPFISVYVEPSPPEQPVNENNRTWVTYQEVQTDPTTRQKALQDFLKQLRGLCERGRKLGFEEFGPVFELVDTLGK